MIGRWFFAGIGLIAAAGTAVVWWLGGYFAIQGDVSVGTLVMFGALVTQLYGPLSAISNSRVEFATSLVSFERVFEVLDLETDLPEASDAVTLSDPAGRVVFDDVSFTYAAERVEGLDAVKRFGRGMAWSPGDTEGGQVASTRTWALEDISFTVQPGQLVALVGPSGAGKTTISYLLPRLYDVTSGAVLIDDIDVRRLTLGSLAESVGVVTQETYLFHDTIAANLRYARPEAGQDELERACQAANIAEFIDSLPDRYETVVGERGYRLSGGEKQRIAIARVILKDPSILVLDEATSHLDTRSEALIQDALEHLMRDRTALVIAHRLSTVQAADVILVLDQGRLVETGTHIELLARGGLYATLYETQFRQGVAS
jgi:ATP-binding cassette subfamily B protein